ncbi:MAG TPA: Asp-tRNA(Asn) amidotransferase subunit GatC [Methanobacteriaceae archaeon]|mgnify:CR=1 FL=1|nr:Asp-tRNA(Asn) amidotransferase subunit GatC [Euryarchaeota archaeon]HNR25581.1 Asp-tRNA(Asn) amidotransferase subunit GatC [Methanobacteriaceae archaeon]HNS25137.1 Asp-tRNA(Asn) amidotransferase subunit GatC [Methanobacteriaceae archaeon]
MKIEKEAEEILKKFSEALQDIPELEETYYIVDNLNREREDLAHEKDSTKLLRNSRVDEDGNVMVEKSKWTG